MGNCGTTNQANAPNPDVSYSPDESDLIDPLLVPQTQIDRLLGCAYGQALGDAYGLSTEFETREQIAQTYPDASKLIPFPNYILTNHSKRWRQGDWTDDTDQWILMLETILHDNGDVKAFAKRLKRWIDCGFPELGDKAGMGIGAHVYQVAYTRKYIEDPITISRRVWEASNRLSAPNGAIMRCSAAAFVHYNNIDLLKEVTKQLCRATHVDPRCLASCLAVCLTIARVIQKSVPDSEIEELVSHVQKETIQIVIQEAPEFNSDEFLWYTDAKRTLEELHLDENDKIGYTYKCLASGFYGLRSQQKFEETLNALIRCGGDADTNGAVCGTMFGARYGYHALPRFWLKAMPFKKWFDQKIVRAITKIEVKTA